MFRRRRFFQGRAIRGSGVSDIAWFKPDGTEMTDEDWGVSFAKTIGVFLNGDALPWQDPRGHPVRSDSFFLIFNAHHEPIEFTVPGEGWGRAWEIALDTASDDLGHDSKPLKPGEQLHVVDRSLVLLHRLTSP